MTVKTIGESGAGQTEVSESGVIFDTDRSGVVRGYEFLNVRSMGIPYEDLPEDIAQHVHEFISARNLNTMESIEIEI